LKGMIYKIDKDCCLLCGFSTLTCDDGEPDIVKLYCTLLHKEVLKEVPEGFNCSRDDKL